MTDEQIKQNAVKYSEQHCSGYIDGSLVNSYIEGAHSLDEEIKELRLQRAEYEDKLRISEHHEGLLREDINRLDELNNELEKTIDFLQNKLRNPWVNVNDRLPEEDPDNKGYSVNVIGMFLDGRVSHCFCSIEEDIWFIEGLVCNKPTHWMRCPICRKEVRNEAEF